MTNTHQPAVLTVNQVSKSYGPRKALDQVSLHVSPGEFIALLGPNGAGKTTLFQLLSGLFVADAGQIHIADADIRRSPITALARIGVVFQQSTLDLDLSVLANLRFHARLHGMGHRSRERIDAELSRLHLSERRNDPVRSLSGGNRRRVELARALVHEPAVLLMDEATVGLDPASRRELLDYVHELCQTRGVGVLWATHLVDEATAAQRVVVLHQGKIVVSDTPKALKQQTGSDDLAAAFLALTGASVDA